MNLTMTRQEFIHEKIMETRGKLISAHRELMQSLDKPKRRKLLEYFIHQCQQRLELYENGKLDIDAEMRFEQDQSRLSIIIH